MRVLAVIIVIALGVAIVSGLQRHGDPETRRRS